MTKDNSTGKNKDFYELGKKMFDRIERESGWRKRQIALDQKAENAKELGLDYAPAREPRWKEWRGLTDEEIQECLKGLPTETIDVYARRIEKVLKEKNT